MTPSQRLVALTVALLLLLFGATAFVGSVHHQVRNMRVRQHIETARALAARNDLAAAAEEYRAVLSLDRSHPGAARALALVLVSLNRMSEAESYLRELLRRDPTNGPLNRDLARIHAARGRQAEARAAFQRAIYGEWPDAALEGRIETRFELIDYLTKIDAREEVIAELLRLHAELPAGQTAAARRIAGLLARQGAAELALGVLGDAAASAPRDTDLLAQVAALQSETGRTADARTTLRRALAVDPKREDLRDRLAVVDRVMALDPTLPGLRLVTRTRRARLVLAAVVEQTRRCAADPAASPELVEAHQEALRRLRLRARADAEAAEQELTLAARLWAAWPACHGPSAEARALAQVLEQVGATLEPAS